MEGGWRVAGADWSDGKSWHHDGTAPCLEKPAPQQIEIESRMLFQLGVLAHETGDDALARRYMQQRIERVSREDGNADMRAEARASFDELEERILEKR